MDQSRFPVIIIPQQSGVYGSVPLDDLKEGRSKGVTRGRSMVYPELREFELTTSYDYNYHNDLYFQPFYIVNKTPVPYRLNISFLEKNADQIKCSLFALDLDLKLVVSDQKLKARPIYNSLRNYCLSYNKLTL